MNLLGKVFIVVIFVMSLVFMAFAVTVFQTHTNWKLVVDNDTPTTQQDLGLIQQLRQKKAELVKADEMRADLQAALDEKMTRKEQEIAKLEHHADGLVKERDQLKMQADSIEQQRAKLAAELETAITQLKDAQTERDLVRQQVVKVQDTRDGYFKEMIRLTDELNQARNDFKLIKAANSKLLEQVSKMTLVLQEKFPNWQAIADGQDPPAVQGVILQNRENKFVAISLGSDDGVRAEHELEIFRADKYVGRVKLIRVDPDQSVAQVLPDFLKVPIQEGDRVRTKFQN